MAPNFTPRPLERRRLEEVTAMNELSAWDLDGTIRPGNLSGDVVLHGIEAGFLDQARFVDPNMPTYDEILYMVSALEGQPHRVFRNLEDRLTAEAQSHAFPWALERLAEQKEQAHIVIFSHSPDFVVKAFARGLPEVKHARGSYFPTSQNTHLGFAQTLHKPQAVSRYIREKGLVGVGFAAGNSTEDLPVLRRAAHSVVVDPAEDLHQHAVQSGWEVVHTGDA